MAFSRSKMFLRLSMRFRCSMAITLAFFSMDSAMTSSQRHGSQVQIAAASRHQTSRIMMRNDEKRIETQRNAAPRAKKRPGSAWRCARSSSCPRPRLDLELSLSLLFAKRPAGAWWHGLRGAPRRTPVASSPVPCRSAPWPPAFGARSRSSASRSGSASWTALPT